MKLFLFLLLLISLSTNAKYYKCNKNLSCGCGYNNVEINARIINGEEAIPYSWSMMVSLRYDFFRDGDVSRHACGGTILSESYILTAASCLEGVQGDIKSANVTIAAGIHRRSQPVVIIRDIDDIIIHPNWTGSWIHDYDIALLHLSEPLDIDVNPYITRTCISSQLNKPEDLLSYPPVNKTLAVVGWGRTFPFGDDSDILRQVFVLTIDNNNTKCSGGIVDPTRQFCAGYYDISAGPCYGDFGGAIFQWMDDHWEQVGIGSFPSDGCTKTSVTGYTRIAYYHDWIEETINNINENFTEQIPTTTTTTSVNIPEHDFELFQCDRHTVPCGCGRRNVRISKTNNTEAIPYSWSTIVSIRSNNENKHLCSGSILSESYILTSVSCIANISSYGITIVAGIHNQSEDNGISRKVDRIYFHPDYVGLKDNNANDIAILHISEELDLEGNLFINKICLPTRYEALPESFYYPTPGARLVVIGWGLMNCENKNQQQILQQNQMYAYSDLEKNCYILTKHRNNQFCAGINNETTVPCVRDPGSPIFEWLQGRWQQVGIASYTVDCSQLRNLGIYTRIIEYKDWIQSIIDNQPPPISSSPSPSKITQTLPTAVTVSPITVSTKAPNVYRCNTTSTCGCGTAPVILTPARIVGGEKAVDYSWPMMVSIRWPVVDAHWCGGTILSDSYILTAAHCLDSYDENPSFSLSISVGMTDLKDSRQIRRFVDRIYIHPNYTEIELGHDIAVLHISQPLPVKQNMALTKTCIHPLQAPILNEQYIKNGTRLTTIGWGALEHGSFGAPDLLQQVEVYAIDNEDPICKGAMNYTQLQFCAGLPEGGKDSCQGDSGGPIFQWTEQYWEQIGIVSFGKGCADAGHPGVYTRLSYYYDWINNILKNDNEHLEPVFPSSETTTKPNLSTTSQIGSSVTNTATNETIPTTPQIDSNTTITIINETIPTRTNNAYNHHENSFLFSILILLFSIIVL